MQTIYYYIINYMTDLSAVEVSEIVNLPDKKVQVSSTVLASPDHPEYTADKAVAVELAGGKGGLIAAIDGVGSGGERSADAAQKVRDSIKGMESQFVEPPTTKEAIIQLKNKIFEARNEIKVLQKSSGDKQVDATVSAVVLCRSPLYDDDRSYVITANVGDSRVYRFRPNEGVIEQLTKDNSLVQSLIDIGQLTEEEAIVSPQRNVVSKTVGSLTAPKDIDIEVYHAMEGDVFFAVSDGVSDNLPKLEAAVIDEFRNSYDREKNTQDVKKFSASLAKRAQNVQIQNTAPHAKKDDTTVAVMRMPRK